MSLHSSIPRARTYRRTLLIAALACACGGTALAQDAPLPHITLQNGHYQPAQLNLAPGVAKIEITNLDKSPIEFESFELHRERVVQPGETITVRLPSLSSGTYKFFDDFHHDTPDGEIVVK